VSPFSFCTNCKRVSSNVVDGKRVEGCAAAVAPVKFAVVRSTHAKVVAKVVLSCKFCRVLKVSIARIAWPQAIGRGGSLWGAR